MARPRGPLPPRISPPDLPGDLESVFGLAPRADLTGARICELSGEVDATHAQLTECAVDAASVSRLELTGASLTDVEVGELRATEVVARNSRWRAVRVTGGRIGTFDLSGAELSAVELRGIRIDYLSLRGATVTDLLVADCVIGSIDLPLASLSRVAFSGSRADEVDTRGLRAEHLDLRGLDALSYLDLAALGGATLSPRQVEHFAPALAAALRIRVED